MNLAIIKNKITTPIRHITSYLIKKKRTLITTQSCIKKSLLYANLVAINYYRGLCWSSDRDIPIPIPYIHVQISGEKEKQKKNVSHFMLQFRY